MLALTFLTLCSSQTITHSLTKHGDVYTIDLEVGTPPQNQTVALDTESVDLWFFGNGTNAPTTFNPTLTSSIEYVNHKFFNIYTYYSFFTGGNDFYTDVVKWGNTSITAQFGLNTGTYSAFNRIGMFGLGMRNTDHGAIGHDYDSYPYALRNQKVVKHAVYSLSLATNEILFGDLDKTKYKGDLATIDFVSNSSAKVNFKVAGFQLTGILHGGYARTFFPLDVYHAAAQSIGMTFDTKLQTYKTTNLSTSLVLSFNNVNITIPGSNLLTVKNGVGYLNIEGKPISGARLGETFMKSAYVVYDLENKRASVAQANERA